MWHLLTMPARGALRGNLLQVNDLDKSLLPCRLRHGDRGSQAPGKCCHGAHFSAAGAHLPLTLHPTTAAAIPT